MHKRFLLSETMCFLKKLFLTLNSNFKILFIIIVDNLDLSAYEATQTCKEIKCYAVKRHIRKANGDLKCIFISLYIWGVYIKMIWISKISKISKNFTKLWKKNKQKNLYKRTIFLVCAFIKISLICKKKTLADVKLFPYVENFIFINF
jgi:hypothetical protein